MIRKNMKLIIGIVMGLIVSGFGVYAVNSLSAGSITIDKSNMSKVETNTLQSALDYLYDKSSKTNMITIESGVLHKSQTYLGVAYLDPTNLDNKCTSANSVSLAETKTGCMKWYIYKDNGTSYLAILDHNVVNQAWNIDIDDDKHKFGTNVAYEDSLVYPVVLLLTKTTEEDVNGSNWDKSLNPRLIKAEEVAEITGYKALNDNTTWTNPNGGWFCLDTSRTDNLTPHCTKMQGTSNYAWLFDNLGLSDDTCISSGCNYTNTSNSGGYWTSTPYSTTGNGSLVWIVNREGNLDYGNARVASRGVRPVITISKSLFN